MNSDNLNTDSVVSDEISIKELFLKLRDWYYYLRSKWIIIVFFGMIGGGLGVTYAYFKQPVYTATTVFVLEDGSSGSGALGSLGGLASMAGIDLGGGGSGVFQGDNILELYKSRTMIEKTLLTRVDFQGKKELLIDRYIAFNNLREGWDKKNELKGLNFNSSNFSRLQDSVLGVIVDNIRRGYLSVVKPDKKLSIIKTEVKSKDEFFAKSFNDHIVQNVNDFYIQTKTKKSLNNIAILQRKTDSVRAVMNGAIYTAAAVSDATPNMNPTRQLNRVAPIQKSQFVAETNKGVLGELVKNLELSKMSVLQETPLIQIIDQPVFPLFKERLGKLKGLIVGGFLGGFLICSVLIVRRILKRILV